MNSKRKAFDKRSFLLSVYGITLAVVLLYLSLYFFFPVPAYKVYILIGLGVVLIAGIFLTLRTSATRVSAHYYIISCYLLLCLNAAGTGGIDAPGSVWFLICPLFGILTLSHRVAVTWLIISMLTLTLFYFFRDYLVVAEFQGGKHWYLIAYSLFFPTAYSFMRIFRIEVSRKSLELNELNKLLAEKQRILEVSQGELIRQRDYLRKAEETALNRNEKTTEYLNQLIEISRMEELHTGSLDYSIQTILRLLTRSMSLDNVVLWHFDERSKCVKLIGSSGIDKDISPPRSPFSDSFRETFEMLEAGVIVTIPAMVPDAQRPELQRQDPSFETSIIDCPYFIEGKFAGFFSCRATDRKWSPEDILFVRAISDTLPLAFKSHQRRQQQLLLEEKQKQIAELNESLEQKVTERTDALKKMNEQLINFAFINSHNIRGPICRLLGLRNLLNVTNDPKEILMLSEFISTSIEELDEITKKASQLLSDTIE